MKTLPKNIHVSELARLTGYTPQWFWELAGRGYFPKPVKNIYDFQVTIRGLLKFKDEKQTPAMERLTIAKANREERRDKAEAGETIPRQVVFDEWANVILITRQRMLSIGNNLQSKRGISQADREAIDAEVRDALLELKRQMIYRADKLEAAEQSEKPAA